jgi:hypothetical protein
MAPGISEKQRVRNRKYAQEHADQLKAYYHRYNEENRERISARNRKRRQENLEELRAREREYNGKNRDRINARQRKYHLEHRDEMNLKRRAYLARRRQEDPEKVRMQERDYNHRHRVEYIRTRTARKRKKIQALNEYKSTLKCSICGQSFSDHPSVMEFHHTGKDPKAGTIGTIIGGNPSSRRLQAELAKCIPVCANCHRKLHYLKEPKNRKAK